MTVKKLGGIALIMLMVALSQSCGQNPSGDDFDGRLYNLLAIYRRNEPRMVKGAEVEGFTDAEAQLKNAYETEPAFRERNAATLVAVSSAFAPHIRRDFLKQALGWSNQGKVDKDKGDNSIEDNSIEVQVVGEMMMLIAFDLQRYHYGDSAGPRLAKFAFAAASYKHFSPMLAPSSLWYDLEFKTIAYAWLNGSRTSKLSNRLRMLLKLTTICPPHGRIGPAIFDVVGSYAHDPRLNGVANNPVDEIYQDRDRFRMRNAIEDLQRRVSDLEHWRTQTDKRLVSLEEASRSMSIKLAALQSWVSTLDSRLGNLEWQVAFIDREGTRGGPGRTRPMPKNADTDGDGIDDRVEDLLLQAYAPAFMFMLDEKPPADVVWFVRHADLHNPNGDIAYLRNLWAMDASRFVSIYEGLKNRKNPTQWYFELAEGMFTEGKSDPAIGVDLSWDRARRRGNVGVYGHVVRANQIGSEYIVQYFLFSTWNETAYVFDVGNHEGDWMMATFRIALPEAKRKTTKRDQAWRLTADQWTAVRKALLSNDKEKEDRVVCLRMGNHGRYIDVRGDQVEWRRDDHRLRPVLWVEEGTHELWPDQGGRGYGGWPKYNDNGRIISMKREVLTGPTAPWQAILPKDVSPRPGKPGVYNYQGRPPWQHDVVSLNSPRFKDGHIFPGVGSGWDRQQDPFVRPAWGNPDPDGDGTLRFRISYDFGPGSSGRKLNEHKAVRRHLGGIAYLTRDIPNIGEKGHPSDWSLAAKIIIEFKGKWGGRTGPHGDNPPGPTKTSMWIGPTPPAAGKLETRPAAQIDPRIRREYAQ